MSKFNSRFQYPHSTPGEKRALALLGGSRLIEFLFAARKWRAFYLAALKRSIRSFSGRFSHIEFRGRVDIPDGFSFDESRGEPRGIPVKGKHFSLGYDITFECLPDDVRRQILAFRSILECFFASEVNVGNPYLWRNSHVPLGDYSANEEVFADAFHQDLVFDQFNAQIFFLLQETNEEHGPFEHLQSDVQRREMHFYRKRDRKAPLTASSKLIGRRGDYCLISTGTTLHRANNPDQGKFRDIMSIPFFPAYTGIGRPMKSLAEVVD